ncbi:MAG: esterase family protein [Lentisphaeria bacterium]|nr:esterase family protein [Lentisphaeria bacterium]
MAFINCTFNSALLRKSVALNAVIPQKPSGAAPEKYRTLFLFHGLSDDYSAWCRYTSIERYAREYNIAVIMPDGGRSFYTDAANGFPYWSFISEELPEFVSSMFPLSLERKDCFAAGLSMGGYGALKLGLRCPERFSAVAGLSPVVDLEARFSAPESAPWRPELENIFVSPEEAGRTGNDLFTLAENAVKSSAPLPKMLSICGTEDFMIEDNRKFNSFMKKINYPEFHSYEYPGSHNWNFWDKYIQTALAFFFDNKLPQQ